MKVTYIWSISRYQYRIRTHIADNQHLRLLAVQQHLFSQFWEAKHFILEGIVLCIMMYNSNIQREINSSLDKMH